MKQPSALEENLAFQIRAVRLPEPVREHKFHPLRKWRFDFAWPAQLLAVEVEGGTWVFGRHGRGSGFEADCEKYAEAISMGWRVLRVTAGMVTTGVALKYIEDLLSQQRKGNTLHA
jgi:very-short-patch-repair endonuclease